MRISDWSSDVCSSDLLRTIGAKSPTSCKVALRLLAHGAEQRDFTDEMRLEYAIAAHMAASHDFIEGVRALLIEKDNAPVWQPAHPERSEEHTSELQSLMRISYAVFCLKKKTTHK